LEIQESFAEQDVEDLESFPRTLTDADVTKLNPNYSEPGKFIRF